MTDVDSTWILTDNPDWTGVISSGLTESACHDHSHFITLACHCGEQMHVHETQIADVKDTVIASTCNGCGKRLVFAPNVLHKSFARLRKQGWIR